jgi:hypothetical protein
MWFRVTGPTNSGSLIFEKVRDVTYLFEYTSIGGSEGREHFFPAVPNKEKCV